MASTNSPLRNTHRFKAGSGGVVFANGYRSEDLGQNWTKLDRPIDRVLAMSPNFEQDGTVLFSGRSSFIPQNGLRELLISTDRGETTEPPLALTPDDLSGFVFSPGFSEDGTLFAVRGDYFSRGLWKSVDRGLTWEEIKSVTDTSRKLGASGSWIFVESFVLSPDFVEDGVVYVSVEGLTLRSSDGGETWEPVGLGRSSPSLLTISPQFSEDRTIFGSTYRTRGSVWRLRDVLP